MPQHQADSTERVVVTSGDLALVCSNNPEQAAASPRTALPWWGVLAGSILTLCLPVLCAVSLATRIALKHRERQKVVWTEFLCTLLMTSGLITSLAVAFVWFLKAPPARKPAGFPLGLVSHDLASSFPPLPAPAPMTAVELAAQARLLVFIVAPEPGTPVGEISLDSSPAGAAALLMADEDGYLLATNRHVAEQSVPFLKSRSNRVLAISREGSYAYADIVARHRDLDLALLWITRRTGRTRFRQPVISYPGPAVGSSIYVIGHPQRLFFTLSNGLLSRVGGDGTFQISAPISPGNSGGPVYDALGNLLGIVTSAFDKRANPNAENLNFATRADAFLSETGWDFRAEGRGLLRRFLQQDSDRNR